MITIQKQKKHKQFLKSSVVLTKNGKDSENLVNFPFNYLQYSRLIFIFCASMRSYCVHLVLSEPGPTSLLCSTPLTVEWSGPSF